MSGKVHRCFLFILRPMIWTGGLCEQLYRNVQGIDLGGILFVLMKKRHHRRNIRRPFFSFNYAFWLLAISTPTPIPKQYAHFGPKDGESPNLVFLVDTNVKHIITELDTSDKHNVQ